MELLQEKYEHTTSRLDKPSEYLIKKAVRRQNFDDLSKALSSKTIYVGNLSHFTTEEQIHELFVKCGAIEKIIMGLDRNKLTPCGFCFVIFKQTTGALDAIKFLKNTCLDGQQISIDLDPGFREGRQFGRGVFGGQASQEQSENGGRPFNRGGFRGRGRGFRGGFRGRPGFRGGRGRGDFRGRGRGGFRDFKQNDSHEN